MIIATFNVNSIRQRVEHLCRWLQARQPDLVCLQELKCQDAVFPREEIEALGYNIASFGQKTFNGVAILSKFPLEVAERGLPGFEDEQARYLEAVISLPGMALRLASIYFPNGNPAPGPKYAYKLAFMAALEAHARNLLAFEEMLVLAGDYNIIPEPMDAADPESWRQDALFLPQSRAAYRRLLHLGFTEAFRATHDLAGHYSFWDYQAGAWPRNAGIRIDHLLLSPLAADRLIASGIDKAMRAEEKPSDHVPVWCALNL
jgi:exodeoxyribonuclease III